MAMPNQKLSTNWKKLRVLLGSRGVGVILAALIFTLVPLWCSYIKQPTPPVVDKPDKIDCNSINPLITSPAENDSVTSPVDLTGTVDKIPENYFLWVAVYNPNTKTYGDFEPIKVDNDKTWKKSVKLIGGKVGDEYIINLILASKEGDNELSKVISKEEGLLPNNGKGMTICCRFSVKAKS